MLLNEHQSKLLFAEAAIPVPRGLLLAPGQAGSIRPDFPPPWYLKTQLLAGGRGKAGGVVRVDREEDLPAAADRLFGLAVGGRRAPFLRLEEAARPDRELYLSFSVSRDRNGFVFTVGRAGGVTIEEQSPDTLLVQSVAHPGGLAPHQVRAAFFHLGLDKAWWRGFDELVRNLWLAVLDKGLLLAEINPLVTVAVSTGDGAGEAGWLALDGKAEIDDNVRGLQPDLGRFETPEHHSPEENRAREAGLAFHSLSGWVGLVANGAGLAMATMDILNLSGLPAANFLDLGGGASESQLRTAFSLLFGDSRVRAVFVNLFGGILSCERVARAMVEALEGRPPARPLVVRMAGNAAEAGRALLSETAIPDIHIAPDIPEALTLLRRFGPAGQPAPEEEFSSGMGERASLPGHSTGPGLPFTRDLPVLVQGITGKTAQLHTRLMLEYGTRIVAGVTPFKGGSDVHGVPVFDSVHEAVARTGARASIIFVPAAFASDAILEAAREGISEVVCITEGIPQADMLAVLRLLEGTGTRLIGPNCPGVIAPGRTKIGIMPDGPFTPGPVAILSRSGTLTYEAACRLSAAGIGQSVAVGIGGDPFVGTPFTGLMEELRHDPETRAVLVIGEIGGRAEEDLAAYVTRTGFAKPVLAFIAGRTAPPGIRLGHAGAIVNRYGAIDDKIARMRQAGFLLCRDLSEAPALARRVL